MKAKLILFFFILATLASFSVSGAAEKPAAELRLPHTTLKRIAALAGDWDCPPDTVRPLGSTHYKAMDATSLLILLELPDYLCDMSNSVVPLLADVRGRWMLGDHLPGLPAFFDFGPDKALWLVMQWQVEATYPSMFRSEDGLHWREIPLPPGPEPGSPFIFVNDLRFLGKDILITLISENGDENQPTQSYSANFLEISTGKAVWQEYIDNGINMPAGCEPARKNESAWTREESEGTREIVFHRNGVKLILPAELPLP